MDDDRKLEAISLRSRSGAVTLEHLRFAVSAAESGSFRRAADALALKQSTLSRRIHQLEGLFGVTMFERSSSGARVTPCAQDVLRVARSILEQVDGLVATAHSISRGDAGRLAIGFYTSLSAGNLRATLVDFTKSRPQVELSMTEKSRARLATALHNGMLDVIVVTDGMPLPDTKTLPLWSERILVVLHEGHPLATRDIIYWTDLRSETILLSRHDTGREFESLLMSKLVSPADRPKIERHDVNSSIINSLVSVGFGVSLVTESDVSADSSGLTYREIRDGTGPSRVGYTAHWREPNDNPVLMSFIKLIRERYSASVSL